MNNSVASNTLTVLVLSALTLFTSTAFAQTTQSDIEIVQETYFSTKMQANIYSQLPYIGELDLK